MNNTSVSSHVPLMARIARVRACMLAEYVTGTDTRNKEIFEQLIQKYMSNQSVSEIADTFDDFGERFADDFKDWDKYSVSSD
jgi:hypothetical protein